MLWRLIFLGVALSGCATVGKHHHAEQIAHTAGLVKSTITANGFVLTAYSRIGDQDQPINVYIEGDGLAWLSRHQLSPDPTPKLAIGLELAALDPAINVVYLARPCQFNDFDRTPCDSTYWSDKRFSEKVIDAMNQELEVFVRKTHHQKINLIGYSGGGAVAALLATRRHDSINGNVLSLRTVAGNLDHSYVNQYHHVNTMPESLNAIDEAKKIGDLPQLHFVGSKDQVIPKAVALRFIAQQNPAHCAGLIEVEAGHQDNWIEQWQQLLRLTLPC